MASALTEEQLNKALKSFKGDFREGLATKDDLKGFAKNVDLVAMENRINATIVSLEDKVATKNDMIEQKSSFSNLQTSVDRYLKFTEAWHQELTILKSRQDRLTQVLVDKGVVSQQEVALLA